MIDYNNQAIKTNVFVTGSLHTWCVREEKTRREALYEKCPAAGMGKYFKKSVLGWEVQSNCNFSEKWQEVVSSYPAMHNKLHSSVSSKASEQNISKNEGVNY